MNKRLHFDWWYIVFEVVARGLLITSGLLIVLLKRPFVREVQPEDWKNHMFPYVHGQTPALSEMFPTLNSVFYTALASIFVSVAMPLVFFYGKRFSARLVIEDCVLFWMGFSLCLLLNWNATEVVKRFYGRLRPDYLGRCQGNDKSQWPVNWNMGLTIPLIPECAFNTNMSLTSSKWNYEIEDGRMSFPSGHSSFMWAGWFYPAVYVFSRLGLFANIGALRLVLPSAFCFFPLIVSLSRTSDYQHHVEDIFVGSLFGIISAFVSCAFYFPLRLRPVAENFYAYYDSRKVGDAYVEKSAVRFIRNDTSDIELCDVAAPVVGQASQDDASFSCSSSHN